MEQWWIRNNKALPDEYKADDLDKDRAGDLDKDTAGDLDKDKAGDLDKNTAGDLDKDTAGDLDEDKAGDLKTFKSDVQDITGCIPLLLDKCIVKGKIDLAAPKLSQVFNQVQEFMDNIYEGNRGFWNK